MLGLLQTMPSLHEAIMSMAFMHAVKGLRYLCLINLRSQEGWEVVSGDQCLNWSVLRC